MLKSLREKFKDAIQRGNDPAKSNRKLHSEFKQKTTAPAKVADQHKYTKNIDTFIGDLPNLEYDFIALDFETANEDRSSACALGIAAFRGKEIVHNSAILINPRTDRWVFYDIHGIRALDVADAPLFSAILEKLYPILKDTYVIAHNVGFDSEVFRESARACEFSAPGLIWTDSKFGIPTWAQSRYWKLDLIAEKLGLSLDHHNAGSDAKVAGQIWTTGMAEVRGSNRAVLPSKDVLLWPTPASFAVPTGVKITQSAFDSVEADLIMKKYGATVSVDLTRLTFRDEIVWALTVSKRQIGMVKGDSAALLDEALSGSWSEQKANVYLRSNNAYNEDGKAEFLHDVQGPQILGKAPLRIPKHSPLSLIIDPGQLDLIVEKLEGNRKE
ncbi:DNA polymerase III PolC-type [Acidithrix ferrooxidans]|uniref:DNA polymerase III PolC-type n=1 Tax=Acidithrix ferrooxidans TaxID=1280514 RepID=A0A0D8HLH2_9ACTN|nr:DNA polymerase III PolC-type [Acidithrix ferrooxidans]